MKELIINKAEGIARIGDYEIEATDEAIIALDSMMYIKVVEDDEEEVWSIGDDEAQQLIDLAGIK